MRLNCTQKDACCMWAYICVQKTRENFFKIYALLLYKFCMMLLPLKHTCFFCCISFNVNCIYSRQRLYCFYRMIVNIANKLSCMIWGQKANKGSFVHTHRSTAQMHREILLKKYYIYMELSIIPRMRRQTKAQISLWRFSSYVPNWFFVVDDVHVNFIHRWARTFFFYKVNCIEYLFFNLYVCDIFAVRVFLARCTIQI